MLLRCQLSHYVRRISWESMKLSNLNIGVINRTNLVDVSFNGTNWNVLCLYVFSVWEWCKMLKSLLFGGGLASYLYMNLSNSKEGEGCNPSHWQDLWTVRRDFPSIPRSSVKFLWVERTHRNVCLATQRLRSQARDCGGQTGVPNVFQTKCFPEQEGKLKLCKAFWLSVSFTWTILK